MTNPPPDPAPPSPGTQPLPPASYPANAYSPYAASPQPVYFVAQPRGFQHYRPRSWGLVSVFFGFTFLVPLGALIFGIVGVKKEPAGRGMAVTGIGIGSLFMLLWLIFGGALIAGLIGLVATGAGRS